MTALGGGVQVPTEVIVAAAAAAVRTVAVSIGARVVTRVTLASVEKMEMISSVTVLRIVSMVGMAVT